MSAMDEGQPEHSATIAGTEQKAVTATSDIEATKGTDSYKEKLDLAVAKLRDIAESVNEFPLEDKELSQQAKLIRDSTFWIATGTSLLYLISFVFGSAYLRFFDISGFQAFGLGGLGLIELQWMFPLAVFVSIVRSTLRTERRLTFVLGLTVMLVVGAIKPLVILGFRNGLSAVDLDAALPTAIVVAVLVVLRKRLGGHTARVEGGLQQVHEVHRQLQRHGLSGDLVGLDRLKGYFSRRISEIRGGSWIFSGYITLFIAIPNIAWFAAATASQSIDGYQSVDGSGSPRIPVYWVGDRVVFVTLDHGCSVLTQINGMLETKRACGRYVRDVINVR